MRTCITHWNMFRAAIEERGMTQLVAGNAEAATENMVNELRGEDSSFDPLMSMNNHFWSEGLRCGGLYLMGASENPDVNEGHYCPVCEFALKMPGFVPQERINSVADQMADYARDEGLIPGKQ